MTDISLTAASRENLWHYNGRSHSLVVHRAGSQREKPSQVLLTMPSSTFKQKHSPIGPVISRRVKTPSIRALTILRSWSKRLSRRNGSSIRCAVLDTTRTSTPDQRKEFAVQLRTLVFQVQKLITDASYQGQNLLSSSAARLTVFSPKADSNLQIEGVNFNASVIFRTTDNEPLSMNISGATIDATLITSPAASRSLSQRTS